MDDAKTRPDRLIDPQLLARRLTLAGAALLWERLWPALWPALGIAGAFLVLALFDLLPRLPGPAHAAVLVLLAASFIAALALGLRRFRLPDRSAERRRIEQASGLRHRPLTALDDRLSSGADPATAALWQIHRRRMAEAARHLHVGWPAAGLVRRDPFALRAALALLLVIAAIDAGQDWPQRLARAVTPDFGTGGPAATASLDIWLTPPDYTGLPPQFLNAETATPLAVPTGTTVLAQVHGGTGTPQVEVDDIAAPFDRIDDSNFKGGATLSAGSRLAVRQNGRVLGTWPIKILPDLPPRIEFAKPPQRTQRAALRLEFQASDDYGVESAEAVITRPGDPSGEAIHLDLPLPGQHLKEAHDASYHDLTAHPWAGLPVEIRLEAKDALDQTGSSETLRMTLPERVFHHPVARAIIEQRRQLTLDPSQREVVAETLSDLSERPRLFGDDVVAFMGLRMAAARLILDQSAAGLASVQQLLWDTAVRIEDGRTSLAQRDLRDAMKALQDALARNAPDAEIQQLMQQLQAAIDRYLQQLAQNMQQQGDQDQQPVDPSRMLSSQDLKNMLDRARELARTGSRQAAQDLLSQLQEMLENLRMARPGEMRGGQGQAMRQMQEMMQRQQQLLDRSFRQSRQNQRGQNGQPGQSAEGGEPQMGNQAGGDMAGQQEALRRQLGDMMRKLGENGDIPQSLGRAERAMRGAADALQRGEPGNAIGPQTEALDQLQQAARSMAEQMMGQNGNGQNDGTEPGGREGTRESDRDPFGRFNPQDHANGGVEDGGRMRLGGPVSNYSLEKAKSILDELRRRAGERDRPEIERDYIDRLLKQF